MSQAPDPFVDPAKLRASNSDREAVAQKLQSAMAEGRLTVTELQERLDVVYASKTLAELEPVTWDLPGHTDLVPKAPVLPQRAVGQPVPGAPGTGFARVVGGTPTSTVAIGVMSGATRNGAWVVPTQFTALALMGGVDIDLTQASFAAREVTITAVALMGGIDITVPEDITVVVDGFGLMGAFEDNANVRADPNGPVVRINGVAIMGGVDIHRAKKRKVQLEK
ncbi:MAG: DUF1707 domain-containing protein [Nakamurella sp.]